MKLRTSLGLLLTGALLAAACAQPSDRRKKNNEEETATGTGTGTPSATGAGGGPMEDPQGPHFLTFQSNVSTLFEGNTVVFTAVVTDPDGATDIVGGSLVDDNGGSYGAFVSSGTPGSYDLMVSWDAIQQVQAIEFAYGGKMARTFIAEFYDMGGHESSSSLTIDLTCSNGWGACNGSCLDTMNDDYNCGTCGNECGADLCVEGNYCQSGSCSGGSPVDCSWLDSECTVGQCDSGTGQCNENNLPNNTTCDDGDPCTTGDKCTTGSCTGTPVMSGMQTLLNEDFSDNTAGWQLGSEWQIGMATASTGQSSLNPDPANDHTNTTDDGVAGVVIGGNANITVTHPYVYITSPIVNSANAQGILTLEYWRWLNSDYTPYMQNSVEVFNGTSWVVLWQSSSTSIADAAWTLQTHDITAYKNSSMRVRFGFLVGSTSAYTCSSWNLDDVKITAAGGMCI